MTEPESTESTKETHPAVSPTDLETPGTTSEAPPPEPEPEPEPEPWTPARVSEWNAYYDLYVVLGVVLLAFVASANRISHSSIWTYLKAGQIMAAKGTPLVSDVFSYTESGHRWVNVPWLFEWTYAQIHRTAFNLIPPDPNEPFPARRAEQVAAGVLVALNALLRVAMVFLVLAVRRPGPGLWWAAVCATLALGAVFSPLGVVIGGIGGPAIVSPETWGQLFLAVELLLLHRTTNLGRKQAALGLVPLFLLWANVHESFLIGLGVLAATVVGRLPKQWDFETDPLSWLRGLVLLGLCAAVCLVNPSFHHVYRAAAAPFLQLAQPASEAISSEQLSYFGQGIRSGGSMLWQSLILFYLLTVLAGVGSFVLNRHRFSLGRFLTFALLAVLWGIYIRFGTLFAVVFATTLTLNGQEWYHDRFGTEGRLGRGWAFWSTGGRFVTILLVFLITAKCLTGYGRMVGESLFGFGYNPDEFAFEAADFLRTAKIRGEVLNTTRLQGDSIIWRAYPQRKTFIDGRSHVFPQALQDELQKVRNLLKDDKADQWKPILDRYKISAVMIEAASSPNTYRKLMQSLNWIPFYDDGTVIMYGRADASGEDVAFFRENRLDPEVLVYQKTKPLPPFDRPPSPMGRMAEVFQNQWLEFAQPHTESARRWLEGGDAGAQPAGLPDPARCILAIREARIALARRPDDTRAYRLLSAAYRDLMVQETALLGGLTLTPENREKVLTVAPRADLLMNRFRQRATALNFAIQTTPPPRSDPDRQTLVRLDLELFQLYSSVNFNDLARDRLHAALSRAQPSDLQNEFREELTRTLGAFDNLIREIQEGMSEMVVQQQANPVQRADFALSRGAPGLAIQELEEALQINVNPAIVKPKLLDLYCDTGQPEKALDLLATSTSIEDATLGAEPGLPALRQGRVYFLLGNYEYASTLWQKNAIPRVRLERSFSGLGAAQALIHGDAKVATNIFVGLPSKLNTQAVWENDLGLCELEAGQPTLAARDLEHALTLVPDLPTRAVTAYYLERLGKTVPPLPKTEEPAKPAAGTTDQDQEKPASSPRDEKDSSTPKDETPSSTPKDEKAPPPKDADKPASTPRDVKP